MYYCYINTTINTAYIQNKTIAEQNVIIECEKDMLLQEVHHRVKNNLQVIVSLINIQLGNITDSKIKTALKETQSRIASMSLVYQKMQIALIYGIFFAYQHTNIPHRHFVA